VGKRKKENKKEKINKIKEKCLKHFDPIFKSWDFWYLEKKTRQNTKYGMSILLCP